MGLLSNQMRAGAAGAAGGGADFYDYQIAHSVRNSFAQDGTILRTPGTPSSTTTMTLSMWVQRQTVFPYPSGGASEGSKNLLFTSGSGGGYVFITTDGPGLTVEVAGVGYLITNALLRDTSAFYHIVLRVDTTQGATANRLRFYINGVEPTYSNVTAQSISQNASFALLASGVAQGIGGVAGVGHTVIGTDTTFAEVVFNDGQSYGPDSYGELKNGVWIPKDPSGLTFGNQGFHLNFANASALGNDVSGNNNDFATANLPAHDQLLSSPTFGSEGSANFPAFSPLYYTQSTNITDGNLDFRSTGNIEGGLTSAIIPAGESTVYYFEAALTVSGGGHEVYFGVNALNIDMTGDSERGGRDEDTCWAIKLEPNQFAPVAGGTVGSNVSLTINTNDIVGMTVDRANRTIKWYINNTLKVTATDLYLTGDLAVWSGKGGGTTDCGIILNPGQDGTFCGTKTAQGNADSNGFGNYYYTPPTGTVGYCTGNLPTAEEINPAQTDDNYPQKLFSPLIYTGNGSNRSITGLGFKPDLTWFKARSNTERWTAYNSTRGTGKYLTLNTDGDEGTDSSTLSAFGADGFSLGTNAFINGNSTTFANFSWRANGGTTSSNSDGSITSTVQVDPSGCFSIGTYTGNATNSTIGHGLSKKPDFIVIKSRAQNKNWMVWSSGLGNDTRGYIQLSTSGAAGADSLWNNTAPTSSVFSVNYGTTEVNAPSGQTYQFYAFANCEGYIKAGSYIGNGNANGSFVYTGFKPAMVLVKFKGSGENWGIVDNKRNPYNVADNMLRPSTSGAESDSSTYAIDILSNGFKPRTSWEGWNGTGSEGYLYLAFAQNPFKYATAR